MDIFYAKSARTNGLVTNKEHLKKVADLALDVLRYRAVGNPMEGARDQ